MKTKYITSLYFIIFSISNLFSQRDFVLSSNGIGNSQENSVQNAIIGSLNQVFGMFYSSNTTIINDSLKLDDFASVSKGNIKELKIISNEEISDNKWFANISLTISLDKIEKYYESQGKKLTYEGSLFSYNIQIQELNELNETKSICNMIEIANEILLGSFDYTFSYSEPISIDEISEKWLINFKVKAAVNNNIRIFRNLFVTTLEGLSMTLSEIENYSLLGKKTFLITTVEDGVSKNFYLRSYFSYNMILNFINSWEGYVRSFDIHTSTKRISGNSVKRETSNRTYKEVNTVKYDNVVEVEKLQISEYNSIYNSEKSTSLIIRLPKVSDHAGYFDWYDFFTVTELEKIHGFTIESNKLLKFKNGGFVVFEDHGHGFVLSPFEISHEGFKNNGHSKVGIYSDWVVPSYEEFIMIKKYIYLNHYCNLSENAEYLTSSEGELSTISVDFHMYNASGEFQEMIYPNQTAYIEKVRLIRKF